MRRTPLGCDSVARTALPQGRRSGTATRLVAPGATITGWSNPRCPAPRRLDRDPQVARDRTGPRVHDGELDIGADRAVARLSRRLDAARQRHAARPVCGQIDRARHPYARDGEREEDAGAEGQVGRDRRHVRAGVPRGAQRAPQDIDERRAHVSGSERNRVGSLDEHGQSQPERARAQRHAQRAPTQSIGRLVQDNTENGGHRQRQRHRQDEAQRAPGRRRSARTDEKVARREEPDEETRGKPQRAERQPCDPAEDDRGRADARHEREAVVAVRLPRVMCCHGHRDQGSRDGSNAAVTGP